MTPNAAMIFAAGFGTRMGQLTKNCPKPLIAVEGRPLIEYAFDQLLPHEFDNIVVNAHYRADQVAQYLEKTNRSNLHLSVEMPNIFETGGGLKHALPLLDAGTVVTLNSDAIFIGENAVFPLLETWDADQMDALLLLLPKASAHGYTGQGDFNLDDAGRLTRRGDAASADYVYSGVQIVKTSGLSDFAQSSFSINLLWDKMLENKRLYGLVYSGEWVDVGRPDGIHVAEIALAAAV